MNAHMLLAVLLINAIKTACIINVKNRTLYPLRNTHIILFTLINLLYFLFLLLHLNVQLTETCLIKRLHIKKKSTKESKMSKHTLSKAVQRRHTNTKRPISSFTAMRQYHWDSCSEQRRSVNLSVQSMGDLNCQHSSFRACCRDIDVSVMSVYTMHIEHWKRDCYAGTL